MEKQIAVTLGEVAVIAALLYAVGSLVGFFFGFVVAAAMRMAPSVDTPNDKTDREP